MITQCLPAGLGGNDLRTFARLIEEPGRLQRGDTLYDAGDPFEALYAIRSGTVKTSIVAEQGHEQITGYHIQGEVIGLDGIGAATHSCCAAALEETEVCVVPFDRLAALARTTPALQLAIYRMLALEIGRNRGLIALLGSRDAHERVVLLLLGLAERYRQRSLSTNDLTLQLTRGEIGSHLGLNLATVSRALSWLQTAGLIQVQGRHIKLLDPPSLRRLIGRSSRQARA